MNINTFKKLCLKSNTDNADKIHDYYIRLEMVYNELTKEQLEQNKRQLQEQQRTIELQEWNSQKEASRDLGVKTSTLKYRLDNKSIFNDVYMLIRKNNIYNFS